jgi:uncharacterized protein (TIGR02466 family)
MIMQVFEEHWFPSQVWFADLDDAASLNEQLLKDIQRLRKSVDSIKRSNELGWHSPIDFHKRPEFAALCERIENVAGKIAKSNKLNPAWVPQIDTFWVNINPKGAYNALHNHPNCVLSGTYYVRTPEKCGRLRFRDPREGSRLWFWPLDPEAKSDARQWRQVNYEPKAGRIVMFPHWLEHDVEANQSNTERVSIAFNLFLKKLR